jgi:hypothetical protein
LRYYGVKSVLCYFLEELAVCRAFETSRRWEVLSFNHHVNVAIEAPDRPPKRRPPGGNPAANFNGIGNISNAPEDRGCAAAVKLNSAWRRR